MKRFQFLEKLIKQTSLKSNSSFFAPFLQNEFHETGHQRILIDPVTSKPFPFISTASSSCFLSSTQSTATSPMEIDLKGNYLNHSLFQEFHDSTLETVNKAVNIALNVFNYGDHDTAKQTTTQNETTLATYPAMKPSLSKTSEDKIPWRDYDATKIRDILWKISLVMEENKQDLSLLETLSGKPLKEAVLDVEASIDVFRFFSGFADKIHGRTFALHPEYEGMTFKEPHGVVGLITSFNYPLLLLAWKLAPALCTRNTILLKPSEETALSSLYFGHLLTQVKELPSGVVSILPGGKEIGEAIVRHPNIHKISFTGSSSTGEMITKQAGMKSLSLELGAKNALIVSEHWENRFLDERRTRVDRNKSQVDSESPSLLKLADIIYDAAFSNMGQNCCAGSKLYIHEKHYSKIIKALLLKISESKWNGLPPQNSVANYGPLASERQFLKVKTIVEKCVQQNQVKLIAGGKQIGNEGYYFEPTVFVDVPEQHILSQEEIFGPVLSIMRPFSDIKTVLDSVNQSSYGLALGLFTQNQQEIFMFRRESKVGMLWVNCYNHIPPYLTLSGRGSSGIGHELGFEALNEFLLTKSIMISLNSSPS